MRKRLKETKKELIRWENRKTDKPISFMMTTVMLGIMVVVLAGKRVFLHAPNSRQVDYLSALGLTSEVFLDPVCKCKPYIIQSQAENE
jgi:hypothetical protein